MTRWLAAFNDSVKRSFPERRIFIRTDTDTKMVRLTSFAQMLTLGVGSLALGWTIFSSAAVVMDSIGSGNVREQALRDRANYEVRLNELSDLRDERAAEALEAQNRFNLALANVSQMQSALLASEERRRELEKGIEVVQSNLRDVITDRDAARVAATQLQARIDGAGSVSDPLTVIANNDATLDVMTDTLVGIAEERDTLAKSAAESEAYAETLVQEAKLMQEKNDRIFSQLEDAVTISVQPLDKMFAAAGMNVDDVLATVRKGYSGTGGPWNPITLSTMGDAADPESLRANGVLEQLDRMNMYRIAAEKAPFSMPLKTSFRYTSPFGYRWGRAHEGMDMAGAYASPVYATADGVVVKAGVESGYGNLIRIKHAFGIETRYGHLSGFHVTEGQRVSRGDLIGDMGNTGRSTGTHLHYEIRVDGSAINPMIFIKAASNVF
ncbi:MAG: M23 family metallopeptidase [Deltaproteobacteria bacterium]